MGIASGRISYLVKTTKTCRVLLWTLIIVGMLLRVLAIYYWSPLFSTASDSLRHLGEALDQGVNNFVCRVEPPIYTIWLASFIRPSMADLTVVFFYAAFMSISMPVAWFLWLRIYFRNEFYALLGFAIFTLMPSFIGIYSFFQPETLLLVLIGLSLWLNQSLLLKPSVKKSLLVGLLWGLSVATRLQALPLLAVSFCWSLNWLRRTTVPKRLMQLMGLQLLVIVAVYSSVPIKIFCLTGAIELAPGMVTFNRLFYQSSARGVRIHVKYKNQTDGVLTEEVPIAHPVIHQGEFFRNFLAEQYPDWISVRKGIKDIDVDYTRIPPHIPASTTGLTRRLELWSENIYLLFFSSSWPEDDRDGSLFFLITYLTRYWMPLFLLVTVLAVCCRVVTLPTVLFFVLLLSFVAQQTSAIEGRYRKPLECIAVVALIDIIRLKLPVKNLPRIKNIVG